MQGVSDIFRLQQRQGKQFFRGSGRQQFIFPGSQSRHTPAGLTGNGHANAALFDYLSDLLQKYRRAIQIDFQNRFHRGLAGGNTRCIDQHGNLTVFLCLRNDIQNRFAGGQIHFHRHSIKPRFIHNLRDGLRIFQFLVTNHNFHAGSHPAGNRHPNLACAS